MHVIYPAWLHLDDDDDDDCDGCERLTWGVVMIVLMLLVTHVGASTASELLLLHVRLDHDDNDYFFWSLHFNICFFMWKFGLISA